MNIRMVSQGYIKAIVNTIQLLMLGDMTHGLSRLLELCWAQRDCAYITTCTVLRNFDGNAIIVCRKKIAYTQIVFDLFKNKIHVKSPSYERKLLTTKES